MVKRWVAVGGAGLAATLILVLVVVAVAQRSADQECVEAELPRSVSNGAHIDKMPPLGREGLIEWATDTAGYDVRMPCYIPNGMVMRGVSVDISPAFEPYKGRRVEIGISSKAEADSRYITGTYMQIAQFPRQGEPEAMEPIRVGVGETAAWKREETTIEPPESDQASSSFAFYLVHKNGGSISVQVTTPPGELPPEDEIRRIIRSMFE